MFYGEGRSHTFPTYGKRLLTVGRVHGPCVTVVWEPQGSLRRIISARRSDDAERRAYDKEHNR